MKPTDEEDQVILVDAGDRAIGTAPKLAAHREGLLHRAVSVQLRDHSGRLLLQKRHIGKYHSGGLWSNTCCSHPRPGEDTVAAAQRRLLEEMGIACSLTRLFTASYRAEWAHFEAAIRGEAKVPSLQEHLTLHRIMDAIYRSAQDGRDVEL